MCSVNSAPIQIYLKIESSGKIKISQSRDKTNIKLGILKGGELEKSQCLMSRHDLITFY